MTVQSIVERFGVADAVPVLLRRFVAEAQVWPEQIGSPIRRPRNKLASAAELKRPVRLARARPDYGAALSLCDGDSDCPAELGPTVHVWATEVAGGVRCAVVLAHREYEAWFLAGIES